MDTKKPDRCEDCGAKNPYLVDWGFDEPHWVCEHRNACEARQMLADGASIKAVADHAQGRNDTFGLFGNAR